MNRQFSEEEVASLVHVLKPVIREEVRTEVVLQLSGISARLTSIENQAAANGEQTLEGRRETAGVAAMLTAFFGTDGTGGSLGILIKNSVSDARRANELAHKIYGHLDTLVGRGWIKKDLADQKLAADEKRQDKRMAVLKWGGGLLATGFGGSRLWGWVVSWFHRHS